MKCQYCGTTENLYKNGSRNTKKRGLIQVYKCRKCNTERCRRFRATDGGKESIKKAIAKYEAANPERRIAWNEAAKCIPLKPCQVCGQKKPVHRHHPDVLKPLEVVFLCPLHHKEAHMVQS